MALGPDKALLAGFGNSALSAGSSFFFPICQGENLAQANGLPFSGGQDAGSGNQALTDGRAQVIDFVLHGDRVPQRGVVGIGQGVVGQVAHHAAMHETVLLFELIPDFEGEHRLPGFEPFQARSQ